MRALLIVFISFFTLGLKAQGYFEMTSCKVEYQLTSSSISASYLATTEGYVLVDLGEEYSVPGPEKNTTLFYWIIEEGLVLSALIPDNSFSPRWVSYVNVKGDITHKFLFKNTEL